MSVKTSYKRRKESTLPMSEATFVKHGYAKPVKRKIKSIEDFDPTPPEFRGSAASRLSEFLENLQGEQLCVSLLFDSQCRRANLKWSDHPSSYYMPDINQIFKGNSCSFQEKSRYNTWQSTWDRKRHSRAANVLTLVFCSPVSANCINIWSGTLS